MGQKAHTQTRNGAAPGTLICAQSERGWIAYQDVVFHPTLFLSDQSDPHLLRVISSGSLPELSLLHLYAEQRAPDLTVPAFASVISFSTRIKFGV